MAEESGVNIPRIVKQMSMAIIRNKGARTLKAALTIARAQLVRGGYLTRGSDRGPIESIKLTPKGAARNRVHMRKSRRTETEFDAKFQKEFGSIEVTPKKGTDAGT